MADTPETPPTKRAKKATPVEPTKGATAATREVTPTAPIKTAATKPGNGAASHGWAAQITPLKEQAEKAARTAADSMPRP